MSEYVTVKVPRWVHELADEQRQRLVENGIGQLPDELRKAYRANAPERMTPGLGLVLGLGLLALEQAQAKRRKR